jgi:integrase/recombinase XerD
VISRSVEAVRRTRQHRECHDDQKRRLDRHGAGQIVSKLARCAAALDAGVPLLDVQEAASHADPRTTMRYDRARASLDRHATYIVDAYIAGAAR